MQKTTVYLEEESLRALKRLAREGGKPEAELIREAVRQYTRAAGRPKPKSLGIVRRGGGVARKTDEQLARGLGADGTRR